MVQRALTLFLLAFFALFPVCLAASATLFCKCTCFSNSTIIALSGSSSTHKNPADSASRTFTPSPGSSIGGEAKTGRGTCSDCTRKFCLDYNLPICKNAKTEDVVTTCFQRDSAKDEAVVFIFILATVGLLVYAAIRPCVEKWAENMRERRSYIPVTNQAGAEES